eukprot:CAMPEP_0194401722 /NCGR_PEP_ID=MMETSP0176-20130528/351_1 /TAXON_ID=216777 /ORGANISM="Proboscia alata, Strain PI-D3" /LENGTH=54 /DNA_ID=CAMNT_0039198593 /DNA_START=35 /DNA_END=196 /DNA_ORIENTATION=+
MKYTAILSALAMGSSAAFAPVTSSSKKSSTSSLAFSAEDMPGVLSPTGFFDPLG